MIALIQRVLNAHVEVDGETTGRIDAGLLALVAVEPGDGEAQTQRVDDRSFRRNHRERTHLGAAL